jgi:DNA-binding CsgD family transcriptional regulator
MVDTKSKPGQLSPRELQVIAALAAGKTTKQICRDLGISKWTVWTHTASIRHKLGVQTNLGAVLQAREIGLIGLNPSL